MFVASCHNSGCCRDGRFLQGDELVNVNGSSLRGVSMEEARGLLRACAGDVDIILARESCRRGGVNIAVQQFHWDTSGPGSRSALQ